MDARLNQNDPYPEIPLSKSGMIVTVQPTIQTIKLNNPQTQQNKDRYASVKHLNNTEEKNSLQNVDILAESSSIGPFPFESNIISYQTPKKTDSKIEKKNLTNTQNNQNTNINTQNNIKNPFESNIGIYNNPQLEKSKVEPKINFSFSNTENVNSSNNINNKNFLTNDDVVNLGLSFNTNSNNNNTQINTNNYNINTNYIDTSRIDKKSYSEKITIPVVARGYRPAGSRWSGDVILYSGYRKKGEQIS